MSSSHYTRAFSPAKTRIWRCGDQSRCPTIPKPDGNPWDICLEPLIEKDRQQCDAWKDEIQNLLIFSGLFSAVVTAFVVQTYEDLQPSAQYTSVLLARLIQLQTNNTGQALLSQTSLGLNSHSSPSASAIRTNICWFSSLVLSLIVVLVGTVALQWLREFQRYPPSLSSKKVFAARNLRAESFESWYAPQIIAGLPQLLQLAVILFFLGLMDTLLQLNRIVALPVIVLGGLAMCFQAITTILPTIQSFWLVNKADFREPPLHCPYKSPQSWAFLRLMTSTLVRGCLNWIGCLAVQILVVPMAPIVMISQMTSTDALLWKFIDRLAVSIHLKYLGTINNWDEFDDLWFEERHRSATRTSRGFHKDTSGTDYDAARGIARIMSSRIVGEPMSLAIYHCFQKIDPSVVTDELFGLMAKGLPPWLFAREGLRKGSYLNPLSTLMVKEENEMFLLNRIPQIINAVGAPPHAFQMRQLELFVRTTAHMFVHGTCDDAGLHRDSLSIYPRVGMDSDPGPLFIPSFLQDVKAMNSIPNEFALDIAEQLVKTFETYIACILRDESEALETNSITEAEPVLAGFMDVVHVASLFLALDTNPANGHNNLVLITSLAFVLNRITSRLTHALIQPLPGSRLLRCGKLYASRFHFTDWKPLQRRAPIFAHSFKSLVHVISLYCMNQGDNGFSYLPGQFTVQWKELREEVLRPPISTEDNVNPKIDHHPSTVNTNNNSREPNEHCVDIDIAESMYPSVDISTSVSHTNPWTHWTDDIPLRCGVHLGGSVGLLPSPTLAMAYHVTPREGVRQSASFITDFEVNYTSSTLHNSPRHLDLGVHSDDGQHHLQNENHSYHIKTYEIV